MKADDVDILRSDLGSINGYKERIRELFGVEISFTAEPSTGDNFPSDNEVEYADPETVRLRLISGSSQESIDQAKSYIASLTAEGTDRDSYAIELDQDNYRMILQSRDIIEKTSQAILHFNNDNTQSLLIHGQRKSVSLARSVVENMVRERTDNTSYCDDVRTRGGVDDDVGTKIDVSMRSREIDVMNQNYSCVESYSNDKPNNLVDFHIPLSDCDENLQTDSGPPTVTGSKDILCEGFNSDADFDDVIIESGEDDNIEEKLARLKSEDLCMLQSRTSDIDEEIVKLTCVNISSPITDDELISANDPLMDPDYNNKVQFALKLGYSEDQLRTVMSKLGSNAEQNELLSELIKLDKYVKPKKDVERTVSDESDKTNSGEFYGSFPASPHEKSSDDDYSVEASLMTASSLLSENFRPVVIDGSNVAMSHGDKETFSCRGIKLAVDWFRQRGHRDITVFVPQWRKETSRPNAKITDQHLLGELEEEKVLVFTPARRIGGRRVICYDDRYILKLAVDTKGIVVSNDNYRDLIEENAEFRKVVEERLLMYSFVNDRFMPPDDPLGRNGPKLDNFLCKEPTVPEPLPPLCPYGSKKCTYGNKCKYYHPERGNQPQKTITEELAEKLKQKKQEVKDRGTKIIEGEKKKPLTKKPKAKVALQRTRSLVPPSVTESTSDDKSHNRHSADLSDLIGDDVHLQEDPEISTEKMEKTKTYNDKLDEYRKLMEKAEQEERKRQEEETKRQVKECDNANKDMNPLCSSLSTSRELLVSRSPSPHQRSCSPSQLKPQEQFLSGHLLLAKKLSDEAAEKKSRFKCDERDTAKTPPAEASHQPSAVQYRCNSPLAQPTPVSQSHHQHKPLTTTPSKQGQPNPSPSPSQPQRKHQSLSRQLSLQGNQDPRLHRTLQQQSSYDPRMLSRQHYHQNMPELERQNIRHAGLQRQPAAYYGEQEHFFTGPLQLPTKDSQQRSQQYFQPYSAYDEVDKAIGSMERPALSRMQSAPEAPQLRKAIAPAKIGRMVRQNSNSDTQLHVLGDQDSPYLGISDLQQGDFPQGDKMCYGDNQGAGYQLQTPHYGRSVSMIAHHPYTQFQSQPQILRAGNTTWSFGGDPVGNRKTFKHGEGHIPGGHSPYTPFHHPLTRASHPRFQEIGAQMHETHLDQGFQKGMFSQREEEVWRPPRNTSPSNFVNPVYPQVDAGYGSTSPVPRGSGRAQNQPFPVSNMYGPSNQPFSQNQQFLSVNKPKLHQTGVNQNYPISNPPLSVPSCDVSASSVGMMPTSDAAHSQGNSEDAPILPNDPRYNVYYHLCGLFPEDKVRAVMNSHPEETNAKELCAYIIGAK